ncbi:MAG TPA: hypothetical protein EYN06_07745 [Myxococcales bacterium]|nr:hypothetical protein [Myxococcales bacterium]
MFQLLQRADRQRRRNQFNSWSPFFRVLFLLSMAGALVGLSALGELLINPTQHAGLAQRIENWSF